MKNFKYILSVAILVILTISCEDHLDTPPSDSVTIENFYQNEDQITQALNGLYGKPWFDFNDKSIWAIGTLTSGNARTWSGDVVNFGNFTVNGDNSELSRAWGSLWSVIAQSNSVINNLPVYAPESISEDIKNNALGEARFIRAAAYFYLVRIWGEVPIIEDNLEHIYSPEIPKNRIEDIYELMRRDLEFAAANCYEKIRSDNYSANAHVSAGSAKALLAKIELYEGNYERSRQLAEEVIQSGEFHLMENYSDLFLSVNNNNPESIFALQWRSAPQWGIGNTNQAYFAYKTTLTGTGDGWGVLGPSIDLQRAYEANDLRRQPTIMKEGDFYPQLLSDEGGFTVGDDCNAQGTDAAVKKYVVGTPADNDGNSNRQSAPINTYIMRYADLLLIHAEAIMGGAQSTSDPAAIESIMKVRERAGLTQPIASFTFDELLHERRIEMAIEFDYWYDLCRIDRQKAIQMISQQERGAWSSDGTQIFSEMYTPTENDFLFPYPSTEVVQNPLLLEPAVAYEFD